MAFPLHLLTPYRQQRFTGCKGDLGIQADPACLDILLRPDLTFCEEVCMSRIAQFGLLLLASLLGSSSLACAQDKFGLVYPVWDDDNGNILYMVDVSFDNCTRFEAAFAWDYNPPLTACPWVICEDDFQKDAPGLRPGVTKPLPARLPFNITEEEFKGSKSRIPRSMQWATVDPRVRTFWAPHKSAEIRLKGKVLIDTKTPMNSIRAVAVFSLTPKAELRAFPLTRVRKDGTEIPTEQAPFHEHERFFALEIDRDGVVGNPIVAKPIRPSGGEFLHQYYFPYKDVKEVVVPAILTK